jgi:hypothetical protein
MKFYQFTAAPVLAVLICAACGRQAPPAAATPSAAAGVPAAGAPAAGLPGSGLPARIVADFSSGKVTLMGSLPTEQAHQRVLERAKQLYGPAHVSDQLAVDPRVIDAPWLSSDALLLPLVDNTISDGQSAFDGHKLTITGEIPSAIMKAQIAERVSKAAPGGVAIENHLQVSQERSTR